MIDVSQVNALAADLGRAQLAIVPKAAAVIRKTASDIEADAKNLAPVDTGNLRSSIGKSVNALHAEIGPSAEYGIYQEYGTSKMAPQPFMGPAFDRRAPGFVNAMSQLGGDIL